MKKIRIGIMGAGRGINLANNLKLLEDCEIIALCEINKKRAEDGLITLGFDIPVYKDFDEFIKKTENTKGGSII